MLAEIIYNKTKKNAADSWFQEILFQFFCWRIIFVKKLRTNSFFTAGSISVKRTLCRSGEPVKILE